jgi:predicted MFS family arabinose efflux permease
VNFALGAGLGGVIAYQIGRNALFIVNACSFIVSAVLLLRIRHRETHTAEHPPLRVRDLFDYRPVRDGFTYMTAEPRRTATLLVKAGLGLLGAHWVILRIFPVGDPSRHAGDLGMSILLGSRGVGALIGSFFSGWWARQKEDRLRTGIVWGFLLVSCSYLALSRAPTLLLACLAVIVGHAGTSTVWVFSTTMLQGMTEDRFRGRVFSADFAGLFAVMSCVSFLAGLLVDEGVSVRQVALATGLLGFVPALLWSWAQRYWR